MVETKPVKTIAGCRLVHTIPAGASFVMLANGRIIVCPKDAEPYVAEADGTTWALSVTDYPLVYDPALNILTGLPPAKIEMSEPGDSERWR